MSLLCLRLACVFAFVFIAGTIAAENLNAESTLSREIELTADYLNLPVTTGAPMQRISLYIEGEMVSAFDIELSESDPDFWAFMDITEYSGKKLDSNVL